MPVKKTIDRSLTSAPSSVLAAQHSSAPTVVCRNRARSDDSATRLPPPPLLLLLLLLGLLLLLLVLVLVLLAFRLPEAPPATTAVGVHGCGAQEGSAVWGRKMAASLEASTKGASSSEVTT